MNEQIMNQLVQAARELGQASDKFLKLAQQAGMEVGNSYGQNGGQGVGNAWGQNEGQSMGQARGQHWVQGHLSHNPGQNGGWSPQFQGMPMQQNQGSGMVQTPQGWAMLM